MIQKPLEFDPDLLCCGIPKKGISTKGETIKGWFSNSLTSIVDAVHSRNRSGNSYVKYGILAVAPSVYADNAYYAVKTHTKDNWYTFFYPDFFPAICRPYTPDEFLEILKEGDIVLNRKGKNYTRTFSGLQRSPIVSQEARKYEHGDLCAYTDSTRYLYPMTTLLELYEYQNGEPFGVILQDEDLY